ncbi:MAG: 6-phosphogluconolactonase [Chlamydiia bacterium]|nr:6-phosphogluconolactonase [Chlamydiia bacterium]
MALSGGSTPKAIFEGLASPEYALRVDWQHVWLFWGDERSVPPQHADSNFGMAMHAGMGRLPIPPQHIFRMHAESHIEANAAAYEALLKAELPDGRFDLVMLGMGNDGHTASLFPGTEALKVFDRWVVANPVPLLGTDRMTLTYSCINAARNIAIYVIGESKAEMLDRVLEDPYSPDLLPSQAVGTEGSKALWILDKAAGRLLLG